MSQLSQHVVIYDESGGSHYSKPMTGCPFVLRPLEIDSCYNTIETDADGGIVVKPR